MRRPVHRLPQVQLLRKGHGAVLRLFAHGVLEGIHVQARRRAGGKAAAGDIGALRLGRVIVHVVVAIDLRTGTVSPHADSIAAVGLIAGVVVPAAARHRGVIARHAADIITVGGDRAVEAAVFKLGRIVKLARDTGHIVSRAAVHRAGHDQIAHRAAEVAEQALMSVVSLDVKAADGIALAVQRACEGHLIAAADRRPVRRRNAVRLVSAVAEGGQVDVVPQHDRLSGEALRLRVHQLGKVRQLTGVPDGKGLFRLVLLVPLGGIEIVVAGVIDGHDPARVLQADRRALRADLGPLTHLAEAVGEPFAGQRDRFLRHDAGLEGFAVQQHLCRGGIQQRLQGEKSLIFVQKLGVARAAILPRNVILLQRGIQLLHDSRHKVFRHIGALIIALHIVVAICGGAAAHAQLACGVIRAEIPAVDGVAVADHAAIAVGVVSRCILLCRHRAVKAAVLHRAGIVADHTADEAGVLVFRVDDGYAAADDQVLHRTALHTTKQALIQLVFRGGPLTRQADIQTADRVAAAVKHTLEGMARIADRRPADGGILIDRIAELGQVDVLLQLHGLAIEVIPPVDRLCQPRQLLRPRDFVDARVLRVLLNLVGRPIRIARRRTRRSLRRGQRQSCFFRFDAADGRCHRRVLVIDVGVHFRGKGRGGHQRQREHQAHQQAHDAPGHVACPFLHVICLLSLLNVSM